MTNDEIRARVKPGSFTEAVLDAIDAGKEAELDRILDANWWELLHLHEHMPGRAERLHAQVKALSEPLN